MTEKQESNNIFFIVSMILLVFALGFIFILGVNSDDLIVEKRPTIDKLSDVEESADPVEEPTNSSMVNEENYLDIAEWGVRFTVPDSLKDTEISYAVYDDGSLGLVTTRVESILKGCKYEDTSGGAQMVSVILSRSSDKDSLISSTDGSKLVSENSVDGYYYAMSGWVPVTTCVDTQMELQKSDADELVNMTSSVEENK